MATKHIGKIFDGRWEYVGKNTFVNIFNGRTFTTSGSNTQHIATGRTTISAIIACKLNNGFVTRTVFNRQLHAIKRKGLIT